MAQNTQSININCIKYMFSKLLVKLNHWESFSWGLVHKYHPNLIGLFGFDLKFLTSLVKIRITFFRLRKINNFQGRFGLKDIKKRRI